MIKRTLFEIHKRLIPPKIYNAKFFSALTQANRNWFATKYTSGYEPPAS